MLWKVVEKVVVTTPGMTFQLLDGTRAGQLAAELEALHAEIYAGPPSGRR